MSYQPGDVNITLSRWEAKWLRDHLCDLADGFHGQADTVVRKTAGNIYDRLHEALGQ